ncbi:hypothetical protein MRB53_024598 [Persea americana]|uniref:Uncharacterized protein n=1 Tax=Persea americana TaxID=3435 RepID=A0ACC2LCT8_PERAE|nr:hypothetical protein MRB53_024598 [Persea americana]
MRAGEARGERDRGRGRAGVASNGRRARGRGRSRGRRDFRRAPATSEGRGGREGDKGGDGERDGVAGKGEMGEGEGWWRLPVAGERDKERKESERDRRRAKVAGVGRGRQGEGEKVAEVDSNDALIYNMESKSHHLNFYKSNEFINCTWIDPTGFEFALDSHGNILSVRSRFR